MSIRYLILLSSLLFLNACGGGGSDSTSNISGSASKGPISGATIIAYTADREELGRTVTDSDGLYTLTLDKSYSGIVIIESSGGSYTDEATAVQNVPAPTLTVATQLSDENEIILSVTPLTDLAYKLAMQDADLTDVDTFNDSVAQEFGLGDIDIAAVIPKNLTKLSASNDPESYYGTVLATLSQIQKDNANMGSPMDVIDGFKVDIETNGRLQAKKSSLIAAIDNASVNPNIKTDSTISNNIKAGLGNGDIAVASVTIDATVVLAVGAAKQLIATVSPSNATDKAVVWGSSNKAIAIVSSNGLVTAVAPGTATVTVTTANNKVARSVITIMAGITDIVAPEVKERHANLTILSTDVVNGSASDFSALFSDDVTSDANLAYKIANYTSIPSGFGVSIGLDGVNSANYAKARPSGNKIYIRPTVGFAGTTSIVLKARDEAGNESLSMQFTLVVKKPAVVVTQATKKPNLQGQTDTLVIRNQAFTTIVFSNSGGGEVTACTSDIPLAAGLALAVTANKQSCQISGKATNKFDKTYTVTAKNSLGDSSATVTIVAQNSTDDADGDGLTNGQELANNLDPLNAADADLNNDGDELTNKEEIRLGMDLNTANDDVGNTDNASKYIYHIANRLTYGAHDSLIQEIKAQGGEAWIGDQLDNPNALLTNDVSQVKRDNVRQGYSSDLRGANIIAAARAVHSNYPLQNVMGDFWDNHFSTLFGAGGIGPHELNDQDYFYLNSLGNFGQLLEYSAKSRSMSEYLNGDGNKKYKANENYAREVMELHTLGIHPNGFQAYDANTIKAVSKIFTGWRYVGSETAPRYKWYSGDFDDAAAEPYPYTLAIFNFKASDHNDGLADYDNDGVVDGDKMFTLKNIGGNPVNYTIMSRAGASGIEEGEELLKLLADHPATAKHICIKLARKFVSDEPANTTISACSQTFLQYKNADDQIAQVLSVLFASNEFRNPASFSQKIKDDQEYILSLYRLLELDATSGNIGKGMSRSRTAGYQLYYRSGQLFFNHGPPTGYPETSEHWLDTMVQYNRSQASNTIISSSWSQPLSAYFTNKGISNAAGVIRYIVPLMTAGIYEQELLKTAYDILYKDDTQFNMQEDRLRVLLTFLAQSPTYHLQ